MMFYCDRTWAISSVSFSGGFLDGHRFDLSHGFNCAIGSRGTGKTTFLELVRFALGAEPKNTAAKKRIDAIVKGNLGGGRVQVKVRTNDGRTYQISRSPGEEPVVLDAQGEPTSFAPQTDGFFKVCVFSQNEIEMIADRQVRRHR